MSGKNCPEETFFGNSLMAKCLGELCRWGLSGRNVSKNLADILSGIRTENIKINVQIYKSLDMDIMLCATLVNTQQRI